MRLRDLIVSCDTGAAVLISGLLWWRLPSYLQCDFCKDVYGVGVSVLSILFSLWAAALALLMTSPDNEFVQFMEQGGHYTFLVNTFKVTLIALFVALVTSIGMLLSTDFFLPSAKNQYKGWFVCFVFLSTYALVAALSSMLDSIRYAERRVRFLVPPNDKRANAPS